MQNNSSPIKNIFITRMIYSAIIQFIILAAIFIVLKNFLYHSQISSITNDLIIHDSFTTEEIAKFELLNDTYALDLELHNLSDTRKLDTISFTPYLKDNLIQGHCYNLENDFKLCKNPDGFYFGVSPIKFNNKLLGYIVAKKKFNLPFLATTSNGLLLILFIVLAGFLFNFFILFISLKKKIEENTNNLIKFITNTDKNSLPKLTVHEHTMIAEKFIAKKHELETLQKDKAYYEARKNIAEQVAHDIRSPIAAINTAIANVSEIPEDYRLIIRNASNRINDIANNLLTKFKQSQETNDEEDVSIEMLFIVLESIVSEKIFEYTNKKINIQLKIDKNSYQSFAKINMISFKRVLSNIINNSVEAIKENGIILVSVTRDKNIVNIIIQDNGCGIPATIIPKITLQGFSYQKSSGAGLGLSHAKQCIEKLGGKINIESKIDLGTKISIQLLACTAPSWFCEKIEIKQQSQIVVLDDDPSIHAVWESKLANVKIEDYFDPSALINDQLNHSSASLYLIDYELIGHAITGLEVIKNLNLAKKSILVTSSFENQNLRKECERLNIKIIPKLYVPYIPITYLPANKQNKQKSLVLIDDDEIVRLSWSLAAKKVGIDIVTFSSSEDFNKNIDDYNTNTIIYIDSELGNGLKGENIAKELYEKGFQEIYLTTGHPSYSFSEIPWIKAIIGKEAPFL